MSTPGWTEPSDPRIERSEALYARALRVIPGATQTLAKGPTQYVGGIAPRFLVRGKGARVVDVDGNEYLDCVMGLGPISLGYAYPAVDEAIRAQLEDGITFSLVHPLEVEVAELLQAVVPHAERVRFSKTGADVTSAAVRIARAFTGRSKVLGCGYHGWHDWHIATTTRARGIPREVAQLSAQLTYNDIDDLARKLDRDTACVIMEPVAFELPKPGFLEAVRALCSERGALLVFDEMWTGFRAALGGAQERFGVRADLACFSKALANGMPLSALTGRADVMAIADQDIFFYTTFGGEALSLAAAKATIGELRDRAVPQHMERLGVRLRDGLNALCQRSGLAELSCSGLPCRTQLAVRGPDALLIKSFVQQELIRRRVLWSGFHALSLSHGDADVDVLLSAYAATLPLLAEHLRAGTLRSAVRGTSIQPVFPAAPR